MNKQELIEKYKYLNHDGFRRVDTSEVLRDLKQLDEPQKVKIPKFVAEWVEYCKRNNFTLFGCLDPVDDFGTLLDEEFEGDTRKCIRWCRKESDKVARAWLYGYEIEKEKRYTVKVKANGKYLNWGVMNIFYFSEKDKTAFAKDKLKKAGFGWVFNCKEFEVEEVKE